MRSIEAVWAPSWERDDEFLFSVVCTIKCCEGLSPTLPTQDASSVSSSSSSAPLPPPGTLPPSLRDSRPHASTIPVPLRIPSQTHVAPRGTYCRVMSLIASCATMPPRRADVCGNVECGVARVLFCVCVNVYGGADRSDSPANRIFDDDDDDDEKGGKRRSHERRGEERWSAPRGRRNGPCSDEKKSGKTNKERGRTLPCTRSPTSLSNSPPQSPPSSPSPPRQSTASSTLPPSSSPLGRPLRTCKPGLLLLLGKLFRAGDGVRRRRRRGTRRARRRRCAERCREGLGTRRKRGESLERSGSGSGEKLSMRLLRPRLLSCSRRRRRSC